MGRRLAAVVLSTLTAAGMLAGPIGPSAAADTPTPYRLDLAIDATPLAGVLPPVRLDGEAVLDGHAATGVVLRLTRSGADGTVVLGNVTVGPDGKWQTVDVPIVPGAYTYRVTSTGAAPPALAQEGVVTGLALPPLPLQTPAPNGDRIVDIPDFSDLVVDDRHQRLYAAAASAGEVQVLDLDGVVQRRISLPMPKVLALSPDGTTLFAALNGERSISVIDTATLEEVGRLPATQSDNWGVGVLRAVAATDDALAYGWSSDGQWGGLATIDLRRPVRQAASPAPLYNVQLAQNPVRPSQLVAYWVGISPVVFNSVDISDPGRPVVAPMVHNAPNNGDPQFVASDPNDVHFTPEGASLLLATGSPYYGMRLDAATYNVQATYSSGAYTNAIATTRDGAVVAVGRGPYVPAIELYDPTGIIKLRFYEREAAGFTADDIVSRSLMFAPDASRLYVVQQSWYTKVGRLHVLAEPLAPCSLAIHVDLPPNATRAHVTGTLRSSTTGALAAATVIGRASVDGRADIPLPAALTAPDGTLSFDVQVPAGAHSVLVNAESVPAPAQLGCHARDEARRVFAPGAPAPVAATAGRGAIAVWFGQPADTGGAPLTAFSVIAVGPKRVWVNAGPNEWVKLLNGLPRGTYDVYVVAWNEKGPGAVAPVLRRTVT